MKNLLKNIINNHFLLLPLVTLIVYICFNNYTPDTWLSGWDTLHPEFNFQLAFERALNGVWRPEQGVGAVAIHSHMSDLPRILILWMASFFLQTNFLRYLYVFMSLFIGPFGVYFLLRYLFKTKNLAAQSAAMIGSFYYVFNLTTLQHYYVPFEMFQTQFAFLPWLILAVLKTLKGPDKLNLIGLFIFSFFSAPQAYAATLFYAYVICLVAFLVVQVLLSKTKVQYLKKSLLVLSIIFISNSFWILPNLYSIKNNSEVVKESLINRNFSEEAFISNQAYGSLDNVLINKNYLFSWREHDAVNDSYIYLLDEWRNHLETPYVTTALYLISFSGLVGVLFTFLKRDRNGISLLPIFFISLFFLINSNPPTGFIYSFLSNNFKTFAEAFRMPFTKFSILFILAMSYFVSYFFYNSFSLLHKFIFTRFLITPLFLITSFIFVWTMSPIFKGNLISPSMRVNIPEAYFELFEYMENEPDEKIAKFPMHTSYGWTYYNWDYEGAGFIPFGLKQPTYDRDFDRWSSYNESFYLEVSAALYDNNEAKLISVLKKYDVGYLLIDESVTIPLTPDDYLYIQRTKDLFEKSEDIELIKKIDFLSIYKLKSVKPLVESYTNYLEVNADTRYSENGLFDSNFINSVDSNKSSFPFSTFDDRASVDIQLAGTELKINRSYKNPISASMINIPDFINDQKEFPTELSIKRIGNQYFLKFGLKYPTILINGKVVYENTDIFQELIYTVKSKVLPKYLSVNSSIFIISEVDDKESKLGNIMVSNDEPTHIKYFSETPLNINYYNNLLSSPATHCDDPNSKFPVKLIPNGAEITVSNRSVCWGSDIAISKPGIISITYEASSPQNLFPRYCLTSPNVEGCLNNVIPDQIAQEAGWNSFTFNIPVEEEPLWGAFVLQGQESGESTLQYRNIKIEFFTEISDEDFLFGKDFEILSESKLLNIEEKVKTLEVRTQLVNVWKENLKLQRGHTNAINCDPIKEGSIKKYLDNNQVFYASYNSGVNCDYLDFSELDHKNAYIVQIIGNNFKGRPLKVYIQSKTNGKLEVEDLTDSGKFDEKYVIYPKDSIGKGYVLNFETRAFGSFNSINSLQEVNVYTLPIEWLQKISITDSKSYTKAGDFKVNNFIPSSNHSFNVQASIDNSGILNINYGYDPGWNAYVADNKLSFFLPFVGHKLEHKMANSWSNAWYIDNQACDKSCNITIIFWPQYLEYIGFIIAIIAAGFIIIPNRKRSSDFS